MKKAKGVKAIKTMKAKKTMKKAKGVKAMKAMKSVRGPRKSRARTGTVKGNQMATGPGWWQYGYCGADWYIGSRGRWWHRIDGYWKLANCERTDSP